jgi:hypothetical protein
MEIARENREAAADVLNSGGCVHAYGVMMDDGYAGVFEVGGIWVIPTRTVTVPSRSWLEGGMKNEWGWCTRGKEQRTAGRQGEWAPTQRAGRKQTEGASE